MAYRTKGKLEGRQENRPKEHDQRSIHIVDPLVYWRKILDIENDDDADRRARDLLILLQKYRFLARRKSIKPFPHDAEQRLRDLVGRFPNFSAPITQVLEVLSLLRLAGVDMAEYPAFLLVGEPGSGKTEFANQLARVLSPKIFNLSVSTMHGTLELAGLTTGYSTGDCSFFAKVFANCDFANPCFILDEIDKAFNRTGESVYNVLLQLMEKTAKNFYDNGLELDLNLGHANFIATANSLDVIPEPLISRMEVIHVDQPAKGSELNSVCRSIWSDLIAQEVWGHRFKETLDEKLVKALGDKSPREMRKLLKRAAARAAQRVGPTQSVERVSILPDDVPTEDSKSEQQTISLQSNGHLPWLH